jgi:ribose transport system substrate-binding protein
MFVVGGGGMKEMIKRVQNKDALVPVDIVPSMIANEIELTALHYTAKLLQRRVRLSERPRPG